LKLMKFVTGLQRRCERFPISKRFF
jgi:hypothetical protein